MSKKAFEEMLNKQKIVKEEKEEHDWEKKKQEWLKFVEQFYDEVEQWLEPYIDQGKLSYEYHDINLTEEYLGTYNVKAMDIFFAEQFVKIEPIGTLLIGTKGRIDMEGTRGSVQFVLADKESKGINISVTVEERKEDQARKEKEPDWTWKILVRESRGIAYDDFNEENFFCALMEIING